MANPQLKMLAPYKTETRAAGTIYVWLCSDCGLTLIRTGEVTPVAGIPLPPNHPNVCDAVPCDGHPTHLRPWYITLRKEVTYE